MLLKVHKIILNGTTFVSTTWTWANKYTATARVGHEMQPSGRRRSRAVRLRLDKRITIHQRRRATVVKFMAKITRMLALFFQIMQQQHVITADCNFCCRQQLPVSGSCYNTLQRQCRRSRNGSCACEYNLLSIDYRRCMAIGKVMA